ncbi:hypothetical protein C8P69_1404 [Phreatobacter oligotrophus]|uniref:Uncharacterized protein n=1 Tax=Phreatobacter oligotrophus TaxID=1122261 RepID=A0A2T4YLF1_9HYPH|nr:hypothetical protein C8P69_1404 [Phreatobacter oligotrophus]
MFEQLRCGSRIANSGGVHQRRSSTLIAGVGVGAFDQEHGGKAMQKQPGSDMQRRLSAAGAVVYVDVGFHEDCLRQLAAVRPHHRA